MEKQIWTIFLDQTGTPKPLRTKDLLANQRLREDWLGNLDSNQD